MLGPGTGKDIAAKLAALDRSQAIIEFETDGRIITANQNFLDALGFSLGEIQGKHHSIFVEPQERDSAEYRRFWDNLRAGRFQQAECKRIGKGGQEVWFQASYNPLLTSAGKAFRVVKFATDITAEKLKNADVQGQSQRGGADTSIPVVEAAAGEAARQGTQTDPGAIVQELSRLGAEKSTDKRLALLRRVADLYFACTASPTLAEEYLFTDIVTTVMARLKPAQRPQVSDVLCDSDRLPHDLAMTLAADADIDIARPILSRSPVLREVDILQLAQASGDDHLDAIATRPTLSSQITDVLIDRGSDRVLRTVSKNAGAQVSDNGMRCLVDRARHDDDLCLSLADRGDLSPTEREQLETIVCERAAEGRGDSAGDSVAALRARASALIAEQLAKRKADIFGTERIIAAVEAGSISLDDGLRSVLDGGRLLDLSTVIAHFLRFDRNFVFQQIAAGDLNTVMLAFRALEISFDNLKTTLALRARKRRGDQAAETLDLKEYEAVDVASAQRAMRFLKVRLTAGAA